MAGAAGDGCVEGSAVGDRNWRDDCDVPAVPGSRGAGVGRGPARAGSAQRGRVECCSDRREYGLRALGASARAERAALANHASDSARFWSRLLDPQTPSAQVNAFVRTTVERSGAVVESLEQATLAR